MAAMSESNPIPPPAMQRALRAIDKRDLSKRARGVLKALLRRCKMNLECWPAHARIAKDAGCGERTVRSALDELIAAGAISIASRGRTGGGRTSNLYRLNPDLLGPDSSSTCTEGNATVGQTRHPAEKQTGNPAEKQTGNPAEKQTGNSNPANPIAGLVKPGNADSSSIGTEGNATVGQTGKPAMLPSNRKHSLALPQHHRQPTKSGGYDAASSGAEKQKSRKAESRFGQIAPPSTEDEQAESRPNAYPGGFARECFPADNAPPPQWGAPGLHGERPGDPVASSGHYLDDDANATKTSEQRRYELWRLAMKADPEGTKGWKKRDYMDFGEYWAARGAKRSKRRDKAQVPGRPGHEWIDAEPEAEFLARQAERRKAGKLPE